MCVVNILNIFQLKKVIESLNDKLVTKGKEINDFREKHGIRVKGVDDAPTSKPENQESGPQSSSGVLVSNKS